MRLAQGARRGDAHGLQRGVVVAPQQRVDQDFVGRVERSHLLVRSVVGAPGAAIAVRVQAVGQGSVGGADDLWRSVLRDFQAFVVVHGVR